MIAFLTGGSGYLGRRVVRDLVASETRVRCLVRATSSIEDLRSIVGKEHWREVEIIRGDLAKPATYASALAGVDIVYHLAAEMSGSPAGFFLNTVVATRAFVRACTSARVPRFVLVSSLGVCGAGTLAAWDTLDETCPIEPNPHRRDPYTFSKAVQEEACRDIAASHGMALTVLRPGVIIGPGRGALSTRVGLTLAGWTLRIGGNRQLPYTYVDNCAAAICLAGRSAEAVGQVINIVDDDLPTVRDVLSAYRRCGQKLRSIWLPQRFIGPASSFYDWYHHYSNGQVPGVITRYQTDAFWRPLRFSNEKAKELLCWQPHVPMSQALNRAIMPVGSEAA